MLRMASATPDLRLPSQPDSTAGHCPLAGILCSILLDAMTLVLVTHPDGMSAVTRLSSDMDRRTITLLVCDTPLPLRQTAASDVCFPASVLAAAAARGLCAV